MTIKLVNADMLSSLLNKRSISPLSSSISAQQKTVQSKAYGAKVVLVLGKGYDTEAAAFRMSKNVFYASHNWHPMFL
jgi:threonine synthase